MRGKRVLAAFLLGVSLCFVPVSGYGEVKEWMYEAKASYMDFRLLEARVGYIMRNPNTFLYADFYYDPDGRFRDRFPVRVGTEGKICIGIFDTRGVFSYKSGIDLLNQFKSRLEVIYSFIRIYATNIDTDIVAAFYSEQEIPLGYFYQGEYHLWEK